MAHIPMYIINCEYLYIYFAFSDTFAQTSTRKRGSVYKHLAQISHDDGRKCL